MNTYASQAEFFADKAQLQSMLVALDAAHSQLRLDSCRTWTIMGKRGLAATLGGRQAVVHLLRARIGQEVGQHPALSHLGKCTQDGDDEGIIRIDALPTPEQAVLIRQAIGLSKRPAVNPEVVKANLSRPSVWPVQGHSTRERPDPAHWPTQEAAE
jgi:hypothetical protein